MQEQFQGIVIEESIAQGQVVGQVLNPNQGIIHPIVNQQTTKDMIVYEDEIFTLVINMWHRNEGKLTLKSLIDKYQLQNITKMKIYKDCDPFHPNSHMIKLNNNEKEFYFAAKNSTNGEWFHRIVWAKLVNKKINCPIDQEFINVCCGEIWKRAQILGGWQIRYVMITPKDGLLSYRDRKSAPTMVIQQTKQIWTRFEFIKGGAFLVIKLRHLMIKEQFAIPVGSAMKWLRAFYSLLKIS